VEVRDFSELQPFAARRRYDVTADADGGSCRGLLRTHKGQRWAADLVPLLDPNVEALTFDVLVLQQVGAEAGWSGRATR